MFNLFPNRIRVLPDEGSDTTGVIVEHTLRGHGGFVSYTYPSMPDPPAPQVPPKPIQTEQHHIVFIKENTVEVKIDNETYVVMRRDNIVGYITD